MNRAYFSACKKVEHRARSRLLPALSMHSFFSRRRNYYTTPATKSPEVNVPFTRAAYAKKLAPSLRLDARTHAKVYHDTRSEDLNIAIAGGGISGLYAALLLKDINFPARIEILEANPDRLGGRIFTKYFDNADGDNYNYFDVGAMRFPKIPLHDRVVGKQKWSLVNYLNNHLNENATETNTNLQDRKNLSINLIPYHYKSRFMHFNGINKKTSEVTGTDPFNIKKDILGKMQHGDCKDSDLPLDYLFSRAMNTLKTSLMTDFKTGFDTMMEIDQMSVRDYMRQFLKEDKESIMMISEAGLQHDIEKIIDTMEAMDPWTGKYSLASMSETIIDDYECSSKGSIGWTCIDGGSSRIIDAMEKVLKIEGKGTPIVNVSTGSRVTKMGYCKEIDKIEVTIDNASKGTEMRTYHHVISTLPFNIMKSLDLTELSLSQGKCEAISALHSDNSCKIGIMFEKRWWQNEGDPHSISGGQSYTDLPSRTIVYPSYGDMNSPGVLITSYTWDDNADLMSTLSHEKRVELSLRDLEKVHGPIVRKQKILDSYSHSWSDDPYVQGAFVTFGPGKISSHLENCVKVEVGGRLHFAGEAASVNPAWVVGSLKSAYRTVAEIIGTRPDAEKVHFMNKLVDRWGTVDELDIESFGKEEDVLLQDEDSAVPDEYYG